MLSKVLAALVASVAVGFAGYTVMHDSSCSHSCSLPMDVAPVSSESCCQTAMPSCCQESASAAPSCDSVCPAEKAAAPAKAKTADDDDDQ